MGRKTYSKEYKVVDQGDISGTITSEVSTTDMQDRIYYEVSWASAGIDGDFEIQISDDKKNWTSLDFSQPLRMTIDNDSHQILIKEVTFKYVRFQYVPVAGAGTMDVSYRATSQGA